MAQLLGDIFSISYAKTLKNEGFNFFSTFLQDALL